MRFETYAGIILFESPMTSFALKIKPLRNVR